MANVVPKRIATSIINSLRGGVVPRIGLEYITVGRTNEINALLNDIDIIGDGGATFRFIVGKYGSGKSFLLQTMRNYAMEKGFVVVDADLSPERRLTGTKRQGLATYKELIKNMSTKTKPDGGALSLILEKWISTVQSEVASKTGLLADDPSFDLNVRKEIFKVVNEIEGMVNGFDFASAILCYWESYKIGDDLGKSNVLRWFRGEYATKTEVKKDLGINSIITDETWYDFLKIFAIFLVNAQYKGMLIIIDELVNISRIPNSVTRQYNYEKVLTMYNDVLQGKAQHIGILMGGTPQSIEDPHRGIFSYEALRSRLIEGRFVTEDTTDLLAPIIRLQALTSEEMYVLIEKLAHIHSNLYNYNLNLTQDDFIYFLKIEYERIGSDLNITPREVIRDFVELLNIIYQNPEKTVQQILGNDNFSFSKDDITDEIIHEEFACFEV